MGTCAVDIEKGSREYTVKYALNSADGVGRLLRDIHRLRSARFERGDYAASDILIDLYRFISEANLTLRQRQAIHYVYEKDMRQQDTADAIGVTREAVSQFISGALRRIAAVYARWNYAEVSVIYTNDNESEAV